MQSQHALLRVKGVGRPGVATARYLGSLSDRGLGLGLILFFHGNLQIDNLTPFFIDSGDEAN